MAVAVVRPSVTGSAALFTGDSLTPLACLTF
jgi:hypothetical protein